MAMPSLSKEGNAMRRPDAAGTTLQVLEPLVQKLTELEQLALRGEAVAVVALGAKLASLLAATGREAIEVLLRQAARAEGTDVPCRCGAKAESRGFERTSFVARFGRVGLERRRMECRPCGRSWFPFDEAWVLPTGEYADDVREATERLACRMGSFDEAVEELRYLWAVAPDGSTAKRWVTEDGTRAAQAAQADAEAHWRKYDKQVHAQARGDLRAPERSEGFGVIEVDGVHVLTWKPGQEPRRKATDEAKAPSTVPSAAVSAAVSETGERALRHQATNTLSEVAGSPMGPVGRSPRVAGREVCMGLTYLGEHACQESPGRGVLVDRRYVATLNDRDGFWPKLHAAATAQGVLSRQKVVRISDGGAHFIEHSNELFCDQPLLGILDCQHAKQHVWEAGHKVVADKKQVPAWVLPRTKAIMDGKVNQVISGLAQEQKHATGSQSVNALDDLTGYLSRHKHMMDYPAYHAAGYPLASAAIESTNKRLVGRRCKQGGMIWSEVGLEAIVALRVAFYNPGAWHALWPHAPAQGAPS